MSSEQESKKTPSWPCGANRQHHNLPELPGTDLNLCGGGAVGLVACYINKPEAVAPGKGKPVTHALGSTSEAPRPAAPCLATVV